MKVKVKMTEFFLELFSEEIPPKLQTNARKQLKEIFKTFFDENKIIFKGDISAFSTPNRLVVHINKIPKEIFKISEEIRGPNTNAPQNALEGFLKSNNIGKNKIYKKKTEKGEFFFYKKPSKKIKSEDVLKDGRKSFENGLPISDIVEDVDTTAWGRVPTNFSIVEAFDNNPSSREYQDVGMDGLRNVDEKLFFDSVYIQQLDFLTPTAFENTIADPSADDFHYFRGSDFDNLNRDILGRYKNYNNLEGNSVTTDQSPESYPTASTNIPNSEDVNRDNTLSETEGYFEYKLRLEPGPESKNFENSQEFLKSRFARILETVNAQT